MQMTILCPKDGEVVVDVSDVKAIVFDRGGHCEISFVCPHCGAELRQPVTPVAMQMAIVDPSTTDAEGEIDLDGLVGEVIGMRRSDSTNEEVVVEVDEERAEAYLEYFRRQLEHVADVESALEEIDG